MLRKKGIGIGIDDFKSVIKDNCYFIDKTKLIEEILLDGAKIKLFCRPRRFGKTLNMSMMKYFFDIREKNENSSLFNGLYIENSPLKEEQGKYPVIFITLKSLTTSSWESFLEEFKIKIFELYDNFKDIIEQLEDDDENRRFFYKFMSRDVNEAELKNSLKFLLKLLYKKYHEKVILLIDEYDTPILTAYENGYYDMAVKFFKGFYGDALKTNEYLQMGVLTGVIRVAQAGIFSDLNNFYSNTILEKEYSQYFGLLESEVEDVLKYYGIDYKLSEVKEWYNGYTFGKTQVYNPWSILHFIRTRELKPFWVNTSSNYLIREVLKNSEQDIFKNLEKLFNKEELVTRVDSNVEVHTHLAENEIYSLMLFSGYLTLGESITTDIYSVRIPNKEIMSFFYNTFINIVFSRVSIIDNVKVALITKNLKLLEDSIEKLVLENLSSFDVIQKENSYHMFLLGFLTAMKTDYEPHSNIESGYGRADIILEPLNKDRTGYVLEIKLASDENELGKKAENGVKQIEIKKYTQFLESKGIKDIVKIGIAFKGKKVEFRYMS
ncbi:AAA family ATPase [Fusobacterium sp.]|uniref:AAA family ATPase n=1 Tax=Fusobacterium sp. TaxID=68766 RepID=UPI002637D907|nr:AAA family ATPase [Fusobacterium sp.]